MFYAILLRQQNALFNDPFIRTNLKKAVFWFSFAHTVRKEVDKPGKTFYIIVIQEKGSDKEEYAYTLARENDPAAERSFKESNAEGSFRTGVPNHSSKHSRPVPVKGPGLASVSSPLEIAVMDQQIIHWSAVLQRWYRGIPALCIQTDAKGVFFYPRKVRL